ncbi:MAG TPA: ferredoxin [Pseudonocardiaceae bacterium]|nr:ferredoxin [Pseudonocardiaceae bacterium]
MRVTATSHTCAVSSLCVYRVPEVFDQDGDGHVVVLEPHPHDDLHDDVRSAARGCPTGSIHVQEDNHSLT